MFQRPQTTHELTLENERLFPFVVSLLREGHTVTLRLKGNSMRPFLEDQRDDALLRRATEVVVGEPVLAELSPGHFVLHRVVKVVGDEVTLLGDGNLTEEHCKRKDIRAQVVGFYRKGSTTLTPISGRKWRYYSYLWTRLRPIRRYLLAVYRRII